jgi:ABC-2 type transport system permease protein
MGEAAAVVAAPDTARLKRAAVDLGTAVGAGAAGGIAGTFVAWLPAFLLTFAGSDYASVGSAVARVLVAGAFIAAGIVLARLDRLPLVIGLGAVAGAAVGALFGPRAIEGFGTVVGAFGPGVLWGIVAGAIGFGLSFTQIPPLMRRELNAFFCSPIAYVVGTVFLFFFGLFYFLGLVNPGGAEASLSGPMGTLTFFLMPIIAPVLTMRLLAEEKRSGTIEVLMTAPVRDWEVVVAKFLAALTAFLVMLVPTLVHVLALYFVSERGPASAPLIGSYLGMTFTAALFLSLGILASALSRDQIVAAIMGFAFSFGVFLMSVLEYLAQVFGWFTDNESARKLLENISYFRHFEGFGKGLIDSRGIIYFLSLIVFVLFLAVRAVESRKWR